MTRLRSTILLVVCSASTIVVGVAGCRGGGKDLTIPGTSLVIDFELPANEPESLGAAYCTGARSIVLAISENVAPTFDHVLLLDTSYQLYGCGGAGQPCARGTVLEHDFTMPLQIVAEWIDLPPSEYESGRATVICRGVYDADSNMGDLTQEEGPAGQEVFRVRIPLLRVGAMNSYFSFFNGTNQPRGTFLGVAPLVSATDLLPVKGGLRTVEGGKILAAGGWMQGPGAARSGMYVFEPDDLGFEFLPSVALPAPRAALSAIPFSIDSTNHFVLLSGGAGDDLQATTESWLFVGDEEGATLLPGPPMLAPRAHHSGIVAPILDGSNVREGVIFAGGCDFDGTDPVGLLEFFVSLPVPVVDPLTMCTATSSGMTFCRRSTTLASVCQYATAGIERSVAGGNTVFWTGGGGAANLPNQPDSTDVEPNLTTLYSRPAGPPALRGIAIAAGRTQNSVLLIGGDGAMLGTTPRVPSNGIYLVNGLPTTPLLTATMTEARSFATATRLLDERILVTGGFRPDSTRLPSYEIGALVARTNGLPTLQFAFEPVRDGTPCNLNTGAGCSSMHWDRAEHSAELVRGSTTWLNGTVVVVGGTDLADPEIYVPAYVCDRATGTLPVILAGTNETGVVSEVDFCDVGKAALLPVMDPTATN